MKFHTVHDMRLLQLMCCSSLQACMALLTTSKRHLGTPLAIGRCYFMQGLDTTRPPGYNFQQPITKFQKNCVTRQQDIRNRELSNATLLHKATSTACRNLCVCCQLQPALAGSHVVTFHRRAGAHGVLIPGCSSAITKCGCNTGHVNLLSRLEYYNSGSLRSDLASGTGRQE